MKIAAYTSSLNSKDALNACIQALLDQTYPVPEIIVVDNRSSDGTTLQAFPPQVTLLCHLRNLGTSGAAATAFEWALERNYDWLWVLDQDTIPRKDALEKLVARYESFDTESRHRVGILASLVILDPSAEFSIVHLLTARGTRHIRIPQDGEYRECDTTIWSGSLYNLDAVKRVGFPRFGTKGYWEDFCLDWGDLEFGYRIKRAGYRVIVEPKSVIGHRIGKVTQATVLGRKVFTSNHPPFRRYLSLRNMVYFWLYIHPERGVLTVIGSLLSTLGKTVATILLAEGDRRTKVWACLRGAWDGVFKRLHCSFPR
jgi:rhamnosyltransferase